MVAVIVIVIVIVIVVASLVFLAFTFMIHALDIYV
jgi:hypothetical protein